MAEGGFDENIELDNLSRDRNNKGDDDEHTPLISKQIDEPIEKTSTHHGARSKTQTTSQSYKNPSYVIDSPPTVDKRPTTLTGREENRDSALERIIAKFPDFKPQTSNFTARVDEFNRVKVRLMRRGSVEHNFFNENGELNSDLPPSFKKDLGPSAEKVIEKIDFKNQRWEDKNREDREEPGRSDISEQEKKEITDRVKMRNERIAEGVQEKERIQDRMSLKDRIKSIFKKHGFTVVYVVTAVGVVIGVIISNLKTGLSKMAKGVGNGLKEIGKKLGAILPWMIGAIASFIFRTAGEVVGFLAKNAWLLIIAVAIAVVDRFKSGASTKTAKNSKAATKSKPRRS